MPRRRALAFMVAVAACLSHPAAGAVISGRTSPFEPDSLLTALPGHCEEAVSRYSIPERMLVLHVRGWSDDKPLARFTFDSTVTPGDPFGVFHGKPDPEPWTYDVWVTDPSGNPSCTRKTKHGAWPVAAPEPVRGRIAWQRDYDIAGRALGPTAGRGVLFRASYDSLGRRIGVRKLVVVP